MSNTSSNSNSSVQVGPGLTGLCTLATIALAILKLTNVLAISWLIVFLPLIIGVGVTLAFIILGIIFILIIAFVSGS